MPLDGVLLLIDGNSLANRAFYALPTLRTSGGQYTNAVYGFLTMLFRVIEEQKPTHVAVAFDKGSAVFRHQEYAEYKAHRQGMPQELRSQMPVLKETLAALNIACFELEGYEADDLIGTMARRAERDGLQTLIFTGDRDALQLVSARTRAVLTRKGISETEVYDEQAVREKYGLAPCQLIEVKALMGDPSDNIPGVPGVGEKTALRLIRDYGGLESVLSHLGQIVPDRLRAALAEYAEQARLSHRLATIDCQAPLDIDWEAIRLRAPDPAEVIPTFRRLEFHTLVEKYASGLPATATRPGPGAGQPVEFTVVCDALEARAVLAEMAAAERLVVHLETEGDMLAGVALARDPERGTYVAFNSSATPAELAFLPISGHDTKPTLVYLLRHGIHPVAPDFDSAIAAYLLDPARTSYRLEDLAREHLEIELPSREESFGKGQKARPVADLSPQELGAFLVPRVVAAYRLREPLQSLLDRDNLGDLFRRVEMPLVSVLARMEARGFRVDPAALAEMGRELSERLEELVSTIHALAGGPFNINSTRQLGEVLFERLGLPALKKTKTGYSTDVEVLESLAPYHPIVEKLLEYRQLVKLKGTYIEGLAAGIDPATGRVHTRFNQTITATGRISSTEPNLQNIPVRLEAGRRIRRAFVPGETGWVLVAADYSQIELRVLAHISGDQGLIEAFRQGQDIHTRTASEVFGVTMSDVTPEMRRRAKAVNFGIVYGISDFGLARDQGISREEARRFIDSYFKRYSGVRAYIDGVVQRARRDGYVTTILNRRRYLPDLLSRNHALRSFAERTAMNTPIQGSAADIIKLAMVEVQRELDRRELGARMILQVHDELVFECPAAEVEELAGLVRERMEGVVTLDVPLVADIKVGPNWYEMKKLP